MPGLQDLVHSRWGSSGGEGEGQPCGFVWKSTTGECRRLLILYGFWVSVDQSTTSCTLFLTRLWKRVIGISGIDTQCRRMSSPWSKAMNLGRCTASKDARAKPLVKDLESYWSFSLFMLTPYFVRKLNPQVLSSKSTLEGTCRAFTHIQLWRIHGASGFQSSTTGRS